MNHPKHHAKLRFVAIGAIIGALGFAVASQSPIVDAQDLAQTSYRTIDREPIVIMDVSGYTFAGVLMHRHLAVYSDGLTSFSSVSGVAGGAFDDAAALTMVARGRVARLHQALLAAGGLTLADQAPRVADVPTTTITIFGAARPGADVNTFSFDIPEGDAALVMRALERFVEESLPDSQP